MSLLQSILHALVIRGSLLGDCCVALSFSMLFALVAEAWKRCGAGGVKP